MRCGRSRTRIAATDGNGNRKIDYPIRTRGLVISMQRKALNLTRMEPVSI